MPKPTVSIDLVEMTRPLCDSLLAKNTHNRSHRAAAVAKLATDMNAGHWLFTGDTIKVAPCGTLADGQHRLMAWVAAGCPSGCWFILVRGVSLESQLVMDRHAKRKLADSLSLALNLTVTTRICAVLNVLGRIGDHDEGIGFRHLNLTESEMSEAFIDWADWHTKTEEAAGTSVRAGCMAALVQYVRYNEAKGMQFARQVGHGLGLEETSPAYRLRKYMESNSHGGAQLSVETYQRTVSAIAAFDAGRKVSILRPSDAWPFPVVKLPRNGGMKALAVREQKKTRA